MPHRMEMRSVLTVGMTRRYVLWAVTKLLLDEMTRRVVMFVETLEPSWISALEH